MNTPSQSYRHKQFGTTIVAVSLPALMVPLLVVWFNKAPAVLSVLAAVAGIQVLVLLLFGSLTVEISGGHVRIRFGAGLIRKRWPLDGIEACRPVRTSWIDGWGIRLTRRGWLYNVSGLDAVELRMRNGKAVSIGTDEPQALCAALEEALAGRNPPDSAGP